MVEESTTYLLHTYMLGAILNELSQLQLEAATFTLPLSDMLGPRPCGGANGPPSDGANGTRLPIYSKTRQPSSLWTTGS